jgi:p-aminobenzoyl-glutamate transporter AbgT
MIVIMAVTLIIAYIYVRIIEPRLIETRKRKAERVGRF